MNKDHDIIIIGAGIGGLTCACLLAKKGLRVLVLERLNRVGGLCSNYDVDGFRPEVGVVWMMFQEMLYKLFDLLDENLEDHINLKPIDPVWHLNMKDEGEYVLPKNVEGVEEVIAGISPADVPNYRSFITEMDKVYKLAEAFFAASLPDIMDMNNITSWGKMAAGATHELISAIPIGMKLARYSVDDFLVNQFKDPRVQFMFGWSAVAAGLRSNRARSVLTMSGYFGHAGPGFEYCSGGAIELPLALKRIAEGFGVEFRLSTEVDHIVVENGEAKGVVINQAEEIKPGSCRNKCGRSLPCDKIRPGKHEYAQESLRAKAVISNVDSRVTYRDLVGPDVLPSWMTRTVKRQPNAINCPALLLGLKEPREDIKSYNYLAMDIKFRDGVVYSDQMKGLWGDYYDAGALYPPSEGFYYIINPSVDESRKDSGVKPSLTIHYLAPAKLKHHDWDTIAEDWGWEIVRHLDQNFLPGLEGQVEWLDSAPPNEMERRLNLPDGGMYGLPLIGLSNMGPFKASHRSKQVERLYLVGQCTNPGPTVPMVAMGAMAVSSEILNNYDSLF